MNEEKNNKIQSLIHWITDNPRSFVVIIRIAFVVVIVAMGIKMIFDYREKSTLKHDAVQFQKSIKDKDELYQRMENIHQDEVKVYKKALVDYKLELDKKDIKIKELEERSQQVHTATVTRINNRYDKQIDTARIANISNTASIMSRFLTDSGK